MNNDCPHPDDKIVIRVDHHAPVNFDFTIVSICTACGAAVLTDGKFMNMIPLNDLRPEIKKS